MAGRSPSKYAKPTGGTTAAIVDIAPDPFSQAFDVIAHADRSFSAEWPTYADARAYAEHLARQHGWRIVDGWGEAA